jgi:ATP-dependent DNA helicase RecG
MIELCIEAGLPEPQFEQRSGFFVITLWRDWLTDEVLSKYNLNERQLLAIAYVKRTGQVANSMYQQLIGVAKRTAHRDLSDLVNKGLFIKIGTRGKGAYYKLERKGP